jgi:predicted transcriptional regulator
MSERINIIRKRVHQLLKSKRNVLHHQTYYALDDQWENIVNSKTKMLKPVVQKTVNAKKSLIFIIPKGDSHDIIN